MGEVKRGEHLSSAVARAEPSVHHSPPLSFPNLTDSRAVWGLSLGRLELSLGAGSFLEAK